VNKLMRASGGTALAIFALLVAGCGGSSEEALSKSEFLKQGNAICAQQTKAREEAISELIQSVDPSEGQKAIRKEAAEKAVDLYEGATKDIAELAAPKGDEAKVKAIIQSMEDSAASIRANPQSAFVGHPFDKANKAVESYGLKDCVA
jgi:hypothetical protein